MRVGPGHRPRLNSCLSFSMARSAILEFIFPRCYFPCVPGSPQRTITPALRGKVGSIMCSLTQSIHFLSYLVFSNQIFQFCSHRSDSPPLRTLTQTMLEVHTQAFTRGSSTLPRRRCSSMHEWTILHVDESTTPFPCVGVVQSATRAILECKRSHARRCSECTEMRTGGPLRPCCGWLPLALPEDEAL